MAYCPDHPDGIVGLSKLLMDVYVEKMPVEESEPPLPNSIPIPPRPSLVPLPNRQTKANETPKVQAVKEDPTTNELNRLAARDRAYLLLSTLTKLGTGWANAEAWLTLARAHELSGQVGKAKQALWWVVELEENMPIRPWSVVGGGGGFTL